LQKVKASELKVGNIIKVIEDQPVPCDILLISSSDDTGICFVTTANLDGETNLKVSAEQYCNIIILWHHLED